LGDGFLAYRCGFSWQISPASCSTTTSPDKGAAKRAFDATMPMRKIGVAAIEAALRGRPSTHELTGGCYAKNAP
jgi:hypothetical protein